MRSIGDVIKALERSIPKGTGAGAPPPPPEAEDTCPICKGAGFLRLDAPITDPNFGRLVTCECRLREQEDRRYEELLRISNLAAFEDKSFDNFDPGINRDVANAMHIALDYATDPYRYGKPWLFFMGRCGTGKTHLAAAVANHYIKHQGGRALFAVVPDLLDHLRATFNPATTNGVTYDQRFQDVRDVPLLILDDLGTENATPWAKEKLFQVFNHRYNERLATVVTTNQDFTQIDERIVSRLLDRGLCQDVPIDAPDYRLRDRETGQTIPPPFPPRRPAGRNLRPR
jgi:DNA replication protein DnaC